MSVLDRASRILDALADTRRRLTLRDIADIAGIPRSSVHRLVQELEELQYLMPTPAGGYRLGPGLLKLALTSQQQIVVPMRPALAALGREVNENVDLAVLSGGEVVVIEQIASAHRLQAVTQVGRTFPIHASSIGKALLAQLPDTEIAAMLPARLDAYTPNTIVDPDALLAEIAAVRRLGFAVDNEEHDIGISSVATSLRHPGGIAQAVSIVAPTHRFQQQRKKFIDALRDAHYRSGGQRAC
ncbi:IclR family transcriptional regulator [Nocardia sp. NPDC019302]|uniref:IclR family transcriptional regulator n=1 Tax=Nocardia sp. NPDC019302 TaxID=3154592 RepID=UPI0033CF34D1